MKTVYFTIAGTRYYCGSEFLKPEMTVRLIKEPENPADKEAIQVEMEGLGVIGYVANSPGQSSARAGAPAGSMTRSAKPRSDGFYWCCLPAYCVSWTATKKDRNKSRGIRLRLFHIFC